MIKKKIFDSINLLTPHAYDQIFEQLPNLEKIVLPQKAKIFLFGLIYSIIDCFRLEVGDKCSLRVGETIKNSLWAINGNLRKINRKIYIRKRGNVFFVGILLATEGRPKSSTWRRIQQSLDEEEERTYLTS